MPAPVCRLSGGSSGRVKTSGVTNAGLPETEVPIWKRLHVIGPASSGATPDGTAAALEKAAR
jgi:hypothetical protein